MTQGMYSISKRQDLGAWIPITLAAVVLSVPMSSTAKSIFLGLAVGFIVFTPSYHQDLKAALFKPWCLSLLSLFLVAAISCVWSPAAMNEKMLVLEKYSKLLYLPILAVGFREASTRKLAINAYLIALFITFILSLAKAVGMLGFHGTDPDFVFHNHIMTGYMMAFAAYLTATRAWQSHGRTRLNYSILTVLFSYQVLFINTGRTGYVVFVLLMGLFLLQYLSFRQTVIAACAGFALLTITFYQNEAVHERVTKVVREWRQYHQQTEKNTSIGYRLQFHTYASDLFKRHPLRGNGTGSFTHLFAEEKPIPSWNRRLLEPHSQYWLIAVEFGILGILALGFFFISLIRASFHLKSMRPIAIAVLLPFLLGNLTDSLLFYSGTGYLFILFMAMCLGESFEKTA